MMGGGGSHYSPPCVFGVDPPALWELCARVHRALAISTILLTVVAAGLHPAIGTTRGHTGHRVGTSIDGQGVCVCVCSFDNKPTHTV